MKGFCMMVRELARHANRRARCRMRACEESAKKARFPERGDVERVERKRRNQLSGAARRRMLENAASAEWKERRRHSTATRFRAEKQCRRKCRARQGCAVTSAGEEQRYRALVLAVVVVMLPVLVVPRIGMRPLVPTRRGGQHEHPQERREQRNGDGRSKRALDETAKVHWDADVPHGGERAQSQTQIICIYRH